MTPSALTMLYTVDPADYHPDAVLAAGQGPIEALEPGLLPLRLGLELTKDDRAAAKEVVARLATQNLEGYPLCQCLTGALILALRDGDGDAVQTTFDAWLTGRQLCPGNWHNRILDAPEMMPWIAQVDPARLELPPPTMRPITPAERAFVQDIDTIIQSAVRENFEWIREWGVTLSEADIIRCYQLESVNLPLCECDIGGDDVPEITVSLDGAGCFQGSFLSH
jgi:hypothetical protein